MSEFREEFRDHRDDMRARLTRIETKLDNHDHPQYWSAYRTITVIVGVVGLAAGSLWAVLG